MSCTFIIKTLKSNHRVVIVKIIGSTKTTTCSSPNIGKVFGKVVKVSEIVYWL